MSIKSYGFETEKSQIVKNYAEIAAKLKSMGLTDEAIEFALNTPKTTLRRWAERQGYEWRKWSMGHLFRFTWFRHPTTNFHRLPIAAADDYAHAFGMGSEDTQKRFRIQFQ